MGTEMRQRDLAKHYASRKRLRERKLEERFESLMRGLRPKTPLTQVSTWAYKIPGSSEIIGRKTISAFEARGWLKVEYVVRITRTKPK